MRKHIFHVFIVLLIAVMQALAMENDALDINTIKDPAILRKDIFDITELLLNDKTDQQTRIKLNNTLAPIYERLIKLHQTKEDSIEIAIKKAKDFCYGVIDDIRSDIEEENYFKRDNCFAYQSIVGRLYEIHYKFTLKPDNFTPKSEEEPNLEASKDLEKACKLLRIKALLYKNKMLAQEIDLSIKLQESQDFIKSLEQKSKLSYESELKKASEELQKIQKLLPKDGTNADIRVLSKLRKSQKKIDSIKQKYELHKDDAKIDEKINEVQDDIQRIKTSLAYVRKDLEAIAQIPQDIIQIDPVIKNITKT